MQLFIAVALHSPAVQNTHQKTLPDPADPKLHPQIVAERKPASEAAS